MPTKASFSLCWRNFVRFLSLYLNLQRRDKPHSLIISTFATKVFNNANFNFHLRILPELNYVCALHSIIHVYISANTHACTSHTRRAHSILADCCFVCTLLVNLHYMRIHFTWKRFLSQNTLLCRKLQTQRRRRHNFGSSIFVENEIFAALFIYNEMIHTVLIYSTEIHAHLPISTKSTHSGIHT